jgi:hypothetical protein
MRGSQVEHLAKFGNPVFLLVCTKHSIRITISELGLQVHTLWFAGGQTRECPRGASVDLGNNEIALRPVTERAPEHKYIEPIKERLSRRRFITDIDAVAVGALGFCVPLSNESPS